MTTTLDSTTSFSIPQISVVVCSYNRSKFIGMALACLTKQSLDRSLFEIIIVDNNSSDGTYEICQKFIQANDGFNIKYVTEKNQGLSFARNRGLQEAHAKFVTYIDDDAEPVQEFLKSIVDFLSAHHDAIGIGGKVVPKYSESPEPEWMNKYLAGFVGNVDFGPDAVKYEGKMKYPAGCNMTYSKQLLIEVGGFNKQLKFRSDDKYIYHKISQISDKVFYVPSAMVYHNIDDNRLRFSSFKKLFLKTGNEEKIRIKTEHESTALIAKFFEFLFKLCASIVLYVMFLLKGQEIKGRYIVLSQFFTLAGFLRKDVFVR